MLLGFEDGEEKVHHNNMIWLYISVSATFLLHVALDAVNEYCQVHLSLRIRRTNITVKTFLGCNRFPTQVCCINPPPLKQSDFGKVAFLDYSPQTCPGSMTTSHTTLELVIRKNAISPNSGPDMSQTLHNSSSPSLACWPHTSLVWLIFFF